MLDLKVKSYAGQRRAPARRPSRMPGGRRPRAAGRWRRRRWTSGPPGTSPTYRPRQSPRSTGWTRTALGDKDNFQQPVPKVTKPYNSLLQTRMSHWKWTRLLSGNLNMEKILASARPLSRSYTNSDTMLRSAQLKSGERKKMKSQLWNFKIETKFKRRERSLLEAPLSTIQVR